VPGEPSHILGGEESLVGDPGAGLGYLARCQSMDYLMGFAMQNLGGFAKKVMSFHNASLLSIPAFFFL
jgi:hypothetical protein